MYVNISRSKLLINNRRHHVRKPKKSQASSAVNCNHCGGAIRPNGELETCIMCAREASHLCDNCSNVRAQVADTTGKSA